MKQTINRAIVSPAGELILICAPSQHNESGAYKFNASMANAMVLNAGCANLQQFLLVASGATFEFEIRNVKPGEQWVNRKTGQTGYYTKAHPRLENPTIKLSDIAAARLLVLTADNINLSGLFGTQPSPTSNNAPNTTAAPVIDNNTVVEGAMTEVAGEEKAM